MNSCSLLPILCLLLPLCAAFEGAQLARGRLFEALGSPSGKLTLSPEIIIPEPTDPTAILLQTSSIQTLSEQIRARAKANAVWVSGAVPALKTFCSEQESARGNFPGPVPVIFCGNRKDVDLQALAEAGALGVIVPALDGAELESTDQLQDESFAAACKSALESGLQPIPEITIGDSTAASWSEEDVTKLVEVIANVCGEEPVSVLLTVNPADEEQTEVSLPAVPKTLGKRVPILGSVRVTAGENRLNSETARFKEAGFTGTVLRSDCVPGFRMNPDLGIVGNFWSGVIADLKSTRSKSFSFRSKNNMEKSMPLEWAKYQKDVMDSGALGDPNDSFSPDLNEATGEYKGFA